MNFFLSINYRIRVLVKASKWSMLHSTWKENTNFFLLITKNISSNYTAPLKNGNSNIISNKMIPCCDFTLNRILAIHFYGLGFGIQEKGLVTLAYREDKTKGFKCLPVAPSLGQIRERSNK